MPRNKNQNPKEKKRAKTQRETLDGKHIIPGRVADSVLNEYIFDRDDDDARQVAEYFEWQTGKDPNNQGERITHLEKVMTENILGRDYDCWDVHTNKGRWWIITSPTSLYSQALFPSLDYTLSFHIGLMARVSARHRGTEDDDLGDRLAAAFRRWEQAAEALDEAKESEDVQAVGMRCRECLLAFLKLAVTPDMVPPGTVLPKKGDFIHWCEVVADAVAGGPHNERIRGYLKTVAKETWQLVSWLTHAANATRYDGTMALDATHNVLEAFGAALLRLERATRDRCERCGSLRLKLVTRPHSDPGDIVVCESCGFEHRSQEQEQEKKETVH